ncbi:Transcription factor RFX4 [Folsomia candida]|uniref:Transcription factor RFX4 n=1 Tax=Folsomia candida TaxID=158441 RepID=A0A226D4D2_FOLCA|nr:Transcription factor RFX4 [Folsomia candida]OXA39116.1 Transcription factor RFX4 [Folsomia candida]
MDGGEEDSPTSPSPEELNTSLLGRIRRIGSSWLGGGSATAPPPAEDVNASLLTITTARKRGRPPKTPNTPVASNFPPDSLPQGDEPGPSTLDPSRLAVKAPRPPRKSVSPSTRADATADATNWLLERIRVSDNPSSFILKSTLMERYTSYCEEKGTEPLIDASIGKEVRKCFPAAITKRQ